MDTKINLCKMFGHKPTWMTLEFSQSGNSQGFACWRCGVRLGWDGGRGFHQGYIYDKEGKRTKQEKVSHEAFKHARSHQLQKTGHWYSVTADDDKASLSCGNIVMSPMERPSWDK